MKLPLQAAPVIREPYSWRPRSHCQALNPLLPATFTCPSGEMVCTDRNNNHWCCNPADSCGTFAKPCPPHGQVPVCSRHIQACGDDQGHRWCCAPDEPCGTFLNICRES
jgi:hypothetical protein